MKIRSWWGALALVGCIAACDGGEGSTPPAAAEPASPAGGDDAAAAPKAAEPAAVGDDEAADEPPAPAPGDPVASTAKAKLKVEGANLTVGDATADGLTVRELACAAAKMPMLGGITLIGTMAKHKPALDACAPDGDAAIVSLTTKGAAVAELDVVGAGTAATDACIAATLRKISSPFDGRCAFVILVGAEAAADEAAKKLLGR